MTSHQADYLAAPQRPPTLNNQPGRSHEAPVGAVGMNIPQLFANMQMNKDSHSSWKGQSTGNLLDDRGTDGAQSGLAFLQNFQQQQQQQQQQNQSHLHHMQQVHNKSTTPVQQLLSNMLGGQQQQQQQQQHESIDQSSNSLSALLQKLNMPQQQQTPQQQPYMEMDQNIQKGLLQQQMMGHGRFPQPGMVGIPPHLGVNMGIPPPPSSNSGPDVLQNFLQQLKQAQPQVSFHFIV
jgi:hypothetical protein